MQIEDQFECEDQVEARAADQSESQDDPEGRTKTQHGTFSEDLSGEPSEELPFVDADRQIV